MDYHHFSEEDFILDESFQAWVRGTDPENNAYWENWLTQHPEKYEMVASARKVLLGLFATEKPLPESEIATAWETLNEALLQRLPTADNQTTKVRPLLVNWRQWAAVLVGFCLLSTAYWLMAHRKTTFSTPYGQAASLTLPDGSQIVLNGNSTLRYAADWDNKNTREVWLEGEGFFSITKQPGQDNSQSDYAHFVVHTPDLDVEVLGTRFNVARRKSKTQVVLTSGKVKLAITAVPAMAPLVMEPGESMEYSSRDEKVVKRKVNPEVYSSWQNNELIFNDTPLYEVADIIERTYGLPMVFENDSQRNRRLTGNIRTDNIEKILKALSRSLNLEFSQADNRILVRETPPDAENH